MLNKVKEYHVHNSVRCRPTFRTLLIVLLFLLVVGSLVLTIKEDN